MPQWFQWAFALECEKFFTLQRTYGLYESAGSGASGAGELPGGDCSQRKKQVLEMLIMCCV